MGTELTGNSDASQAQVLIVLRVTAAARSDRDGVVERIGRAAMENHVRCMPPCANVFTGVRDICVDVIGIPRITTSTRHRMADFNDRTIRSLRLVVLRMVQGRGVHTLCRESELVGIRIAICQSRGKRDADKSHDHQENGKELLHVKTSCSFFLLYQWPSDKE